MSLQGWRRINLKSCRLLESAKTKILATIVEDILNEKTRYPESRDMESRPQGKRRQEYAKNQNGIRPIGIDIPCYGSLLHISH